MQTLIQAYCRRGPSLRERIARDRRLSRFDLEVIKEKQPGRSPGWLKLRSRNERIPGVANVEWDKGLKLLTCRVVTKLGNPPDRLVGDLVSYLIRGHGTRVESITVALRR
jgi:hypothetical protein